MNAEHGEENVQVKAHAYVQSYVTQDFILNFILK